jgi:hypothetical protein
MVPPHAQQVNLRPRLLGERGKFAGVRAAADDVHLQLVAIGGANEIEKPILDAAAIEPVNKMQNPQTHGGTIGQASTIFQRPAVEASMNQGYCGQSMDRHNRLESYPVQADAVESMTVSPQRGAVA